MATDDAVWESYSEADHSKRNQPGWVLGKVEMKMKKLMIAAAAALWATVGFADVESSNIVGYYGGDNFRAGNTMYTPMFTGMAGAEYSIQDIKPVGKVIPDGSSSAKAIKLQKLTATGTTDGYVYWWMDYYDEDEEEDMYGWKRAALFTDSAIKFKVGEAFWLNMPSSAECTLQFNGEVAKGNTYILLKQGNTAVGNPTPTTVKISDILPVGESIPDGSSSAKAIKLQKLTATGATDGYVYWWMDYYDEDEEDDMYGWKRAALFTDCAMTLAPGEGIWVNCPNGNTSLRFPAAISVAE